MRQLPERLNLAAARRCAVACRGCYSLFGGREPELEPFLRSAETFARMGMRAVTLSGGDPLTLPDLPAWLAGLRAAGYADIKIDTVGVGLIGDAAGSRITPGLTLGSLLAAVDCIAVPLDGFDRASTELFRRGRRDLHAQTLTLLAELDAEVARQARVANARKRLVVNTVVHRGNVGTLARIAEPVAALAHLFQWNLFQYTPNDQANSAANADFAISDAEFAAADSALEAAFAGNGGDPAVLAWRSHASRLGQYLLINSDGEAWLPDHCGRTLMLGCVFGREAEVLHAWADAVRNLMAVA